MKFLDCIQISPPVSLVKGKIYSFIEMANVSTVFREPDYIDVKAFSSGTKFEDGDTVIARIEPCLQNGKRFFVKGIGKGFGSTEFLVFRPKTIGVDNKYLYYFMKTEYIQQLMVSSMTGATGRQRVNNDIFADLEISLPDISVQRRIASILSAYDDLIENNRRQIKLLEEAAQRLYREWFVELRFPGHEGVKVVDGVPEGWKKQKLVDIADVQYGFAFDGKCFNNQRSGTPIIRIRNIPDGTTSDYTTESADSRYVVHNGEIVVGMDGEFHINTWNGEDAYLVQRTCCIRPTDKALNGWLLYAIYEPIKFYEKTVVGSTVAHLGKKHVDTIELLTSPSNLYKPFVALYKKRQVLLNQNRKLSKARDHLLPKLMSREMEV